jgi:hypothetical protein
MYLLQRCHDALPQPVWRKHHHELPVSPPCFRTSCCRTHIQHLCSGILIQGFGYSQLRTQLLQTPAFAIQVVVSLLVTGLVTFTKFFRYAKQPLLSVAAGCVVTACAVTYTHYPSPENRHLLLGMMYMIAINNCSYTVSIKRLFHPRVDQDNG